MGKIEIKRINDELYLNISDLESFQNIYDSLEEKLMLIKEQNINNLIKINLILGHRNISSQDLFCLCELIFKEERFLIKSIDYNSLIHNNIEIYNGSIRGGETKYFNDSVLILGDINPNALVFAINEVYVVGKVRGKIIIRSKDGGVHAAQFNNAFIKIFDLTNSCFNSNGTFFIRYNNLLKNERKEKICQEL